MEYNQEPTINSFVKSKESTYLLESYSNEFFNCKNYYGYYLFDTIFMFSTELSDICG